MSSLGCVCIALCAPRFDHGVFVPLMLALPAADIPIVCISLHSSLSAKVHVQVGQALAPLRSRGVIILGSGYSFHNMRGWFQPTKEILDGSKAFDTWLRKTVTITTKVGATSDAAAGLPPSTTGETLLNVRKDQREEEKDCATTWTSSPVMDALMDWTKAPSARLCHPREEHLLPLMVVAGAAGQDVGVSLEGGSASKIPATAFVFGSF